METVSISGGNIKLGVIPSVSLTPIATCNKCAGCTKRNPKAPKRKLPDCFAVNMIVRRPNVGEAWAKNLRIWKADPVRYFGEIDAFLREVKPDYFRFHVGGDIPSPEYLSALRKLARRHTGVRILVFTKRYDWLAKRPSDNNVRIVASAWPGLDMPAWVMAKYPIAWMRDKLNPDDRIPDSAVHCPGKCESCHACWHIRAGQSVVFDKH